MSNLPLLEKALRQELPEVIQLWLDPSQPLPSDVQYIRAYVPVPFVVYKIGVLILIGFAAIFCYYFIARILNKTIFLGHAIVFSVFILLFFFAAYWLFIIGKRAQRFLKEHKEQRNRVGFFLAKELFLSFDGHRVWLLPKENIEHVHNNVNPKRNVSSIIYRKGTERLRFVVSESYMTMKKIESWHAKD